VSQSTCNGPDDRDASQRTFRSGTLQGKARTVLRCRLCGERIVLESNFRATPEVCPHCGLKFVFDPQQQPLPVRGMRLRLSDVTDAERRGHPKFQRRHDAHLPPPLVVPQKSGNYLAWTGTLAIASAGLLTLLSWLRR